MTKLHFLLKIGAFYILLSAIFFLPSILSQISANGNKIDYRYLGDNTNSRLSISQINTTITSSQQKIVTGIPTLLYIPRLNLRLTIINGEYNQSGETWTLTPDKAQFATITTLPNNVTGNTLIYGHDTSSVFYPTKDLEIGDKLIISTSNGHEFTYSYSGSDYVLPTNTSILDYQGTPQVTLLTCNGWFDEKRRLMFFKFISVN